MHQLTAQLQARFEDSPEPVGATIVEYIWHSVVEGLLPNGERLPTTREVAIALGVTPRLVERAYEELERRGVVATRPGEGTFVSIIERPEKQDQREAELAALCRVTAERAAEMGFGLDELIDALSDLRNADPEPVTPDRS